MEDKEFLQMEKDFYKEYDADRLSFHYKNTPSSRLNLFLYFELRRIRMSLEKLAKNR